MEPLRIAGEEMRSAPLDRAAAHAQLSGRAAQLGVLNVLSAAHDAAPMVMRVAVSPC